MKKLVFVLVSLFVLCGFPAPVKAKQEKPTMSMMMKMTPDNLVEIHVCNDSTNECRLLGGRAFTLREVQQAKSRLQAKGWMGYLSAAALVAVGASVGLFVLPAAYFALTKITTIGALYTIAFLHGIGLIGGAATGAITAMIMLSPNKNLNAARLMSDVVFYQEEQEVRGRTEDLIPFIENALKKIDEESKNPGIPSTQMELQAH